MKQANSNKMAVKKKKKKKKAGTAVAFTATAAQDKKQTKIQDAKLSKSFTAENLFSLAHAQVIEVEPKEMSKPVCGEDPWVIHPLKEHLAIVAHSIHAPLEDGWEIVSLPTPPQGMQDDDKNDNDTFKAEEKVKNKDGGSLLRPPPARASSTGAVTEQTVSFLSIPTKASALKGDVNNSPESGSVLYFFQTMDKAPCSYYLWLRVCFVSKNRLHGLIVQPGDATTCETIKWRLDTMGVPECWHWQLCPFSFRLAAGIARLQISFCTLGVRVSSLWLSRSDGQFPPNYRNALGASKQTFGTEQQRLFKCGKMPWLDPQFRAARDPHDRRVDYSQRIYVKNGLRARRRNARILEDGGGELLSSSLLGVRSVFVLKGEVYDDSDSVVIGTNGKEGRKSRRETMVRGSTERRERSRETVMENRRLGTFDRKEKVVLFPDAPHHDMEASTTAADNREGMMNVAREAFRVDPKYEQKRRPHIMRAQALVVEDSQEALRATKKDQNQQMEHVRDNIHEFNHNPLDATWNAIQSSFIDAGKDTRISDVFALLSDAEESDSEKIMEAKVNEEVHQ